MINTRIVGNPDHERPAIFPDIVNSVRNGDPDRIGAEVMIIDATGNQFPTPAGIFEITDELAFFAVQANDGQMTALEVVAQLGQIFELEIAVGTGVGGDLLLVDSQGIAQGMEQTSHGIGGDGNAEFD